jgi:hypothetical protein
MHYTLTMWRILAVLVVTAAILFLEHSRISQVNGATIIDYEPDAHAATFSFVIVEIPPTYACDGQILSLTCLVTMIQATTDGSSFDVPWMSDGEIKNNLCSELLLANIESSTAVLYAHVDLCIQHEGRVGAAVKLNSNKKYLKLADEFDADQISALSASSTVFRFIRRKHAATVQTEDLTLRDDLIQSNAPGRDNFGNFVWIAAFTRLINRHSTLQEHYQRRGYSSPGTYTADALLIPMANFLQVDKVPSYEVHARFLTEEIKKYDVPTAVVGIGTQAEFQSNFSKADITSAAMMSDAGTYLRTKKLDDSYVQFLNQVELRQYVPAIAVRGEYELSFSLSF